MNKFYLLLLALFTSIGLSAQPAICFEKTFGTPSTQDTGNSLIELADGNLLFVGTSNVESKGSEIYLAKTDTDGNEIWSKTYGTETNETGIAVQELEDGSLMVGGTTEIAEYHNGSFLNYDKYLFLVKTNNNGEEIWSKSISVSHSTSIDISFNADGSLLTIGNGKLMLKVDAEGNQVWRKNTPTNTLRDLQSVRGVDETGFLITGTEYIYQSNTQYRTAQTVKIDSEGNLLWSATIEGVNGWVGKDAIFMENGDCVMLANAYQGGNSIMIQRVDESGQVIWTKEHQLSDKYINGQRLLESSNGDLYVVGEGRISTSNRNDAFILQLNSEGEKISVSNYNHGTADLGKNIIESENGELLLVGNTRSFNGTGLDLLAMKVTSTGDEIWHKSFGEGGDSDFERSAQILQLLDGSYLIAGHANSISEFGDSDIYLLQLSASGEVQWTKNLDFFHGQDYCYRIVVVGEGGYALWGKSEDETGELKQQLTRIDMEGNILWEKQFDSSQYGTFSNGANGAGISSLSDGGFAICSTLEDTTQVSYYAKLDAEGDVVWERTYKAWSLNSIRPTSDGGFILSGRGKTLIVNEGTFDERTYMPVEVIKTNSGGALTWNYYWGNPYEYTSFITVTDAIETPSGEFAWAANIYAPEPHINMGLLDQAGKESWRKSLGVGGFSIGFSLASFDDCDLLISGVVGETYSGQDGAIVAKMSCEGQRKWVTLLKDEAEEQSYFSNVIQTQDGGFAAIGNTIIDNSSQIIFLKTEAENPTSNPCFTSIETHYNSSSLQLKPNLSRDFVQLNLADEHTGKIEINVFDTTGRLTHSIAANKRGTEFQTWLDVKNWNEGLYIIEVLSGDKRYTHKLMKQ